MLCCMQELQLSSWQCMVAELVLLIMTGYVHVMAIDSCTDVGRAGAAYQPVFMLSVKFAQTCRYCRSELPFLSSTAFGYAVV